MTSRSNPNKGRPGKKQAARERIAAQRAAQQRAERRRRFLLAGGAVVVVVVIVVVFVVIKLSSSSTPPPATSPKGTALPASVASQVTSVPPATLATVGSGSSLSFNPKSISQINGSPIGTGKPEVLYIGAEYCPYCATERWAMTVALSRFGTFSPLHGIHSAPSPEVYPSTATLTYYGGTYTSKYLTFTSVETQKVDHSTLQNMSSQQSALLEQYTKGGIPFVYFDGKYALTSVSYNPQVLAGKSWSQIAAALHDPTSAIAQGADGSANLITAAICKLTNGQPVTVCSSSLITGLQSKL
jgi:hypothetical protein